MVDSSTSLWAHLRLGYYKDKVCTHYSDGGDCLQTETRFGIGPLDPKCQTTNCQSGPLTASRANSMNLQAAQASHAGAAITTTLSGFALAILTNGLGLAPAIQYGTGIAAGAGFMGLTWPSSVEDLEAPYKAGDNVSWTLEVCNDGNGGVNATLSQEIG